MSRGVVTLLVRTELRRSWRSLLGLALIVAVVGTVVLASAAGARRTASSIDRAQADTLARDVRIQVDDDQAAADVAASLAESPEVAAIAAVRIFPTASDGELDLTLFGDPDGHLGHTIDQPLHIEGRLPSGPDEVALNTPAAQDLDLGLGARLRVGTFGRDDLEGFLSGEFTGYNGPALDLRVVGLMETLDDLQGGATFAGPFGFVSRTFLREHADVAGFPPVATVRLVDPERSTDVEERVVESAGDADVTYEYAEDTYGVSIRRTVRALSIGLVVFALVAGIAGLLTIGQAVSRQVQAAAIGADGLRQLGMDRRSRTLAVAIPVTAAVVVGVVAGAFGSVLASPLFPIGVARKAEVDTGIRLDLPVVLVGALVLGTVAAAVAIWRSRPTPSAKAEGAVPFAAALLQPILPSVVPLIGARLALEPGRGRRAVPVRSGVLGAVLGAVGILAVGVVAFSMTRLVDEPDRWGWAWSTAPEAEDPEQLAALPDDDRLNAVAELQKTTVVLDGEEVAGFSLDVHRGDISLRLREGRAPVGDDEVVLGHRTADALDVGVGDHVAATRSDGSGTEDLTVVGEAVFPIIDNPAPGDGSILTPAGLDRFRQTDGFGSLLLDYRDDLDVDALEADLTDEYGLVFSPYARPSVPGDVANIGSLRTLTVVLGGFFVAMAIVALAHVLLVSSRRRRPDFAVLRAFGFRRRQVRRSVGVQAVVIVVVGSIVGVPLGWAVGRLVWRLMVGDLGVIDDPSAPWALAVAFLPASIAVALAVAAIPAWNAARPLPAAGLRAE